MNAITNGQMFELMRLWRDLGGAGSMAERGLADAALSALVQHGLVERHAGKAPGRVVFIITRAGQWAASHWYSTTAAGLMNRTVAEVDGCA
ncbi:hypothetical protein [Oceanibacterium hippocampi]|uniref:MarR family transcriptional regulator n=1 Tax=Oceanibacterium hippocampi TaxID=745714 RepID=A0A1Y5TYZ3_9PROT|nr:hypothetical protein [Oceanibacterium hippocampi]SLN77271.1 hypothetical protein OCH7691_04364 [Oceanibacterium hippocampi]